MKKTIFLIVITFCISSNAYALKQNGKKLHLYGSSAISQGRAGTGVASFGTDLFYLNPASIADIERFSMGVQYGSLPFQINYKNPDVSLAIPTSYGVFGTDIRYYNFEESTDFKRGYSLMVGGAKDFTPRVMIGFSLNLFNGLNSYYTGFSIGSIYKFSGSKNKTGFGLFDPKIGFAINFGIPFGKHSSYANFNSVTAGYNFKFYRNNIFSIGFFNDVTALNYKYFPVKVGLESEIYKKFVMRTGFILPDEYDYGSVSFGLGYKFKLSYFEGSLNYAINHYKKGKFVHYVGLNFEYGRLDRLPPETEIVHDVQYISPNYDGIQDYVQFKLSVEDESRIKGWKLQVIDSNQNVIKEFKILERDITKGLTPGIFFKRLFQKKESMVVPEKVMWDGTDSNGKIVADGKYSYSFTAWDARDNIAAIKTGLIFVDNSAPEVKLQADDYLFSPNGDNKKDIFIIHQTIKSSPEDDWIATIKDSNGITIKSIIWKGNTVPNKVIWNGKDNNGKDVPEGLYYYNITSVDKAGNRASADINEISLTRSYEIADITLSSDYISFKNDKEINLFPHLSNTKGMDTWKIIISNAKKKVVKEISGTKEFPKIISWDGKDKDGDYLKDGEYYIKLSTAFKSGNIPESFEKKLIIDSTRPKVKISHSPDLFSPDNDGENDLLTINPTATDTFGIKEWKIYIYAPSGDIFKSFEGKGDVPNELKWDGLGENKDIVESAADYFIELEAVDAAGNISRSKKDTLKVDILVIVTERGLKMRISNIEFAFASDKLMKKGIEILDRVYTILQKYQKYNVLIEGHTDDIGQEDYNLELSEKRAKSVLKYLIDKGIDEERLKFVGMGETVPLYPNTNDENRRRNRRVEFLLIKKSEYNSPVPAQ